MLFGSAACLFGPLALVTCHGILSYTLLWRCSSQSFATSHGLLGSSPTLCPLASLFHLLVFILQDIPPYSRQVLLPESLLLRSFSIPIPRLHALLLVAPLALFGPLALVLVVVGPLALR